MNSAMCDSRPDLPLLLLFVKGSWLRVIKIRKQAFLKEMKCMLL